MSSSAEPRSELVDPNLDITVDFREGDWSGAKPPSNGSLRESRLTCLLPGHDGGLALQLKLPAQIVFINHTFDPAHPPRPLQRHLATLWITHLPVDNPVLGRPWTVTAAMATI